MALQVINAEDGTATTTPPTFATAVGDEVILTDLTLDMLRPEPRDLLLELAEQGGDVARLADRRGQDLGQLWGRLVEAAEELGADSVGSAAALASTMLVGAL